MEIFKLFGSILIDTDKADKSLSKIDTSAKGIATALGKGVTTAAKWGAAIGTAAVGAAGGMYKMATSAASVADDVDKMSQKIGVSREAYQELSFALSQSGTDVSKLQTGLKTLSAQAEKGNAYFEKLGISLTDINENAKSQEELFFELTDALQNMEEGTEKTTIATTLLGKAGTELMPLFNGAAGSLDEMRQQAHDLGLVLNDEIIDNGVNLTDALDQMKRSLSSVMTQLGGRLMPIVEKAADFITENIPKINGLIEQIAPIFEESLDTIVPILFDLASNLLPAIMDIATALLPPISKIFEAITPIVAQLIEKLSPILIKILNKLLPPLIDAIDAFLPLLDFIWDLLDPILEILLDILDPIISLIQLLAPIIDLGVKVIKLVLSPLKPLLDIIADLLSNVLGDAITTVADIITSLLMPVIEGLTSFLGGNFIGSVTDAGSEIVNAFSNAFGTIDSLLGTNLQDWYNDITNFAKNAGAQLYQVLHADEIAEMEKSGEVSGLRSDLILSSNEYMRQGMSASDALAKAKTDYLTDSEKQALFDAYLASELTDAEAEERLRELKATGQIPHLANGGVVYGRTLAVVGDNPNAANDPEIVAPRSELKRVMGLQNIEALLMELLNAVKQQGSPTVVMDGQKVATIVTNIQNGMRYNRGAEVV